MVKSKWADKGRDDLPLRKRKCAWSAVLDNASKVRHDKTFVCQVAFLLPTARSVVDEPSRGGGAVGKGLARN